MNRPRVAGSQVKIPFPVLIENTDTVTAPESGIIIGRLNIPLVHEGDAIFHIARLDHDASVEAALQEYQELIDSDWKNDADLT